MNDVNRYDEQANYVRDDSLIPVQCPLESVSEGRSLFFCQPSTLALVPEELDKVSVIFSSIILIVSLGIFIFDAITLVVGMIL